MPTDNDLFYVISDDLTLENGFIDEPPVPGTGDPSSSSSPPHQMGADSGSSPPIYYLVALKKHRGIYYLYLSALILSYLI